MTGGARWDRLREENPDVAAIAGPGPFKAGGHTFNAARLDHGRRVGHPIFLVEICRQEPAGFIRQQRIDTGDEVGVRLSPTITATEMPLDHIVRDGDECLVWAFPAFHLWLAAYPSHPFISAGERIARSSSLPVFPADGKYVLTTYKQSTEERDLIRRRGGGGYGWRVRRRRRQTIDADKRLLLALKRREAFSKLCPFGIQRSKPGANVSDLFLFGVVHLYRGLGIPANPYFQNVITSLRRVFECIPVGSAERNARSGRRQP